MDEPIYSGGRVHTRHIASFATGPGQDPDRFTVYATITTGDTYRVAPDFPTQADAEAELDRLYRDALHHHEWLTVHPNPPQPH